MDEVSYLQNAINELRDSNGALLQTHSSTVASSSPGTTSLTSQVDPFAGFRVDTLVPNRHSGQSSAVENSNVFAFTTDTALPHSGNISGSQRSYGGNSINMSIVKQILNLMTFSGQSQPPIYSSMQNQTNETGLRNSSEVPQAQDRYSGFASSTLRQLANSERRAAVPSAPPLDHSKNKHINASYTNFLKVTFTIVFF